MRKNRIFSFLILYMSAAMIVGCQEKSAAGEMMAETEKKNMFGLTESEQKTYAEYAAGVLMKYNAGTNMRVLEGQRLVRAEEEEQAKREKEEKRQQLAEAYQDKKGNSSDNNKEQAESTVSTGTDTDKNTIRDVAAAVDMENFSIRYIGYEITDSYPDSGEDIFFAMDATTGKDLLVVKFEVTNNSNQTLNFDMFSKQAKFKVKIKDKTYKAQYTLLLNDLSMYKADLEAGTSVETVLIFEIMENAGSGENMELTIAYENQNFFLLLNSDTEEIKADVTENEGGEESNATEIEDDEESEIIRDSSDLASEYMQALEAEESAASQEAENEQEEGNVTVVGGRN